MTTISATSSWFRTPLGGLMTRLSHVLSGAALRSDAILQHLSATEHPPRESSSSDEPGPPVLDGDAAVHATRDGDTGSLTSSLSSLVLGLVLPFMFTQYEVKKLQGKSLKGSRRRATTQRSQGEHRMLDDLLRDRSNALNASPAI